MKKLRRKIKWLARRVLNMHNANIKRLVKLEVAVGIRRPDTREWKPGNKQTLAGRVQACEDWLENLADGYKETLDQTNARLVKLERRGDRPAETFEVPAGPSDDDDAIGEPVPEAGDSVVLHDLQGVWWDVESVAIRIDADVMYTQWDLITSNYGRQSVCYPDIHNGGGWPFAELATQGDHTRVIGANLLPKTIKADAPNTEVVASNLARKFLRDHHSDHKHLHDWRQVFVEGLDAARKGLSYDSVLIAVINAAAERSKVNNAFNPHQVRLSQCARRAFRHYEVANGFRTESEAIATEDQIVQWADNVLIANLDGAGADDDAITSIMEEIEPGDLLKRLHTVLEDWAQEWMHMLDSKQPPPKPDKERIAEVAGKVTELPPPTEAQAAQTLAEDCDQPASFEDIWKRCKAKAADRLPDEQASDQLYQALTDHGGRVASEVIHECVDDGAWTAEFGAAVIEAYYRDLLRGQDGKAFRRMIIALADAIRDGVHDVKERHDTSYMKSTDGGDHWAIAAADEALKEGAAKVADRLDGSVIDPDKAAEAFRKPPLGKGKRAVDIALRMAQNMAAQATEQHPLEVANWMVVCERGLRAHLDGAGPAEVEQTMAHALTERKNINPDLQMWEPDRDAFNRAVAAIPERAAQVEKE